MLMDQRLNVISQTVFSIDNQTVINGGQGDLIFGGVLNKDKGFDYALLRFDDKGGSYFSLVVKNQNKLLV